MTPRCFSWSLGCMVAAAVLLAGCGGGGESDASLSAQPTPMTSSPANGEVTILRAHEPAGHAERQFLGHGADGMLLVGTSSNLILQVQPRTGHTVASLSVDVTPAHMAVDAPNLYFGGAPLQRYDASSGQLTRFATSDGFTTTVAMAIAPSRTLFASNLYYFAPDTTCGTCSTMVAYPDPNGLNPSGRINYLFGYVRDTGAGNGRLSGQQIDFTRAGKLLVASLAGDGIYVSTAKVDEVCCDMTSIEFNLLVADAANTTIRFATRGHRELLVLHSTGTVDQYDLHTGAFVRHVVHAGIVDPIEMAVSEEGSIFVLERAGTIKGFSAAGHPIASFVTAPTSGQPLSIEFCCKAGHRRDSHD